MAEEYAINLRSRVLHGPRPAKRCRVDEIVSKAYGNEDYMLEAWYLGDRIRLCPHCFKEGHDG